MIDVEINSWEHYYKPEAVDALRQGEPMKEVCQEVIEMQREVIEQQKALIASQRDCIRLLQYPAWSVPNNPLSHFQNRPHGTVITYNAQEDTRSVIERLNETIDRLMTMLLGDRYSVQDDSPSGGCI